MSKSWSSFMQYFLRVLAAIFILTGCGGGGSDAPAPSASLTYTGLTTQAIVTAGNAEDLAMGSYQGGTIGTGMSLSGAVVQGTGDLPYMIYLSDAFKQVFEGMKGPLSPRGVLAGATVTESGTEPGPYGGSASYSITGDDVTGDFTGSIVYSNFSVQPGTAVTGPVSVSGRVDVNTGEFLFINMTYSGVTVTIPDMSVTIEGTGNFDFQAYPVVTLAMSANCRDNSSGKVYRVESYSLTITYASGYFDFLITGRFYNPDYGYVHVTTDPGTPFRVMSGHETPSRGILFVEGRPGSAGGNTRARLTTLSSTTYRVEADTDGDGAYDDWDSGILNW